MIEFYTAVFQGVMAFTATNIDDLLILMLFFSQVNRDFTRRQIVFGQYFGFFVLTLLSLLGYFGLLVVSGQWAGLLGLVPIGLGIRRLLARSDQVRKPLATTDRFSDSLPSRLNGSSISALFNLPIFTVAAVTIANGGDNIGIYIPLFASNNLSGVITIICTLFILVGVWCYVGNKLVHFPAVAKTLERNGHNIMPWVLIGLGVFIIIESDVVALLFG